MRQNEVLGFCTFDISANKINKVIFVKLVVSSLIVTRQIL